MSVTPRIGAPVLVVGQAVPETTVNEITRYLEAVAARVVVDKDRTAPAGTESDGDCFIVPASATGAWAGQDKSIAMKVSTAWVFIAPFAGLTFFVQDEGVNYRYSGSAWAAVAGGGTAASLDYDTDGTLAANSDSLLATQKAVRTFVAAAVTGLMDLKGSTDCSANPNYPAASKGDAYVVSVAGKIGGGSGTSVDIGDVYVASADNVGGTQASVGASWFVLEHNLAGALLAANNLSDLASAATARTNLGATTVGGNVFTLTNPSAVRFLRVNADNSVDALDAASFRAAIGAGTGSGGGDMVSTNNLSDVASVSTARSNLGLAIGTNVQAWDGDLDALAALSGTNTIYYRSASNTWSAVTIGNGLSFAGGSLAISEASSSEMWTGSSSAKVVTPKKILDAAAPTALTDGATVTPDFNTGFNFEWTIGGNRTLANPTNAKSGQSGTIKIVQDATGSRVITYGNNWRFPGGSASGGVLSTAANAIDLIAYTVGSDGKIYATLSKAFAA